MLQRLLVVVPVLMLVVVAGFVLVGATTLSLATDAGLTDEDVCREVASQGPEAVRRLEAAGFPRASTSDVEVYRLTRSGTAEAVVRIDWAGDAAACLPLAYDGVVTASVDMTDGAYGVVVGEIREVLRTGELSGHTLGNLIAVWFGTDITIPENPRYEGTYEWRVARWTAGFLASGGGVP